MQQLWSATKCSISFTSIYSCTHTPAQMEVFGPAVCSYTSSFHSIIISQTSTYRIKIQDWIALCLCREIYAFITPFSPSLLLPHFFFIRTITKGASRVSTPSSHTTNANTVIYKIFNTPCITTCADIIYRNR